MVPGRRYNLRFFVRTLRRAWWIAAIPLALTGSIAVVVARALPDVYYAQSVIRIVPPRLPDNYVKGTVTLALPDRLDAATRQVFSPQQIEALIAELDVYPTARGRVPADALVRWFRSSIRVAPVSGDTFVVGYFGYSRTRVQKVAEKLTTLIVDATRQQREALADNTGQFLETELEAARRRLEEHEGRVSEFRRRYAGQLPTQVEANLGLLQVAATELQTTADALTRDYTRRDELARELEAATAAESTPAPAEDEPEVADPPPGNPTATLPAGPPSKQLRAARILRARMLRRFTPEYPDMQTLDRSIAELEKAAAAAPAQKAAGGGASPQLRIALKALDTQIAAREAVAKRLRDTVAAYRDRVDAVPEREADWMRLTRDYNTLQGVYANLLAKREEQRIAGSIGRQAVGEQLNVIEHPRRPEKPSSPNRRGVVLAGTAVGAGIGLVLLVLRELRDRTLRAEEEVLAALSLPVVGLVPRIITALDRRNLRRRRLLWSFAVLVICVGIAALRWHR
jgi:succinoglycan biosynthesis transport protein ExoP